MSARAPEVERDFGSSETQFKSFVQHAEAAMSVRRIPHLLQLGGHPWLKPLSAGKFDSSRWVTILSHVIYRCDDISQFRPYKDARKRHEAGKRARTQAAEPWMQKPRITLNFPLVLSRAGTEHFRSQVDSSHVYSMPANVRGFDGVGAQVVPLRAYLAMPAMHRQTAVANQHGGLVPDIDEDEDGGMSAQTEPERIFFRVVHKSPGDQRVQARAPGVGQRLAAHHIAICVVRTERSFSDCGGATRIAITPGSIEHATSSVISYLGNDMGWLRQRLLAHSDAGDLRYHVPLCNQLSSEGDLMCHRVLDSLLQHCALPTTNNFYQANADQVAILKVLEAAGIVAVGPAAAGHGWQLTACGIRQIKGSLELSHGVPILEPRVHLPVAELSIYERLVLLQDIGWQWAPLPDKSSARLALVPYLLDASPSDGEPPPKVFYTGLTVPSEYLQCLLQADELRAAGIPCIPRGLNARIYTQLLQGRPYYAPAKRARQRMLADDDHEPAHALPPLASDEQDVDKQFADASDGGSDAELFLQLAEERVDEATGDQALDLESALEALLDEEGIQGVDARLDVPDVAPGVGAPAGSSREPQGAAQAASSSAGEPRVPGFRHEAGPRVGKGEPWGCFLITYKSSGQWGGFQARCPFHKGTATAAQCKKFISIPGSTTADTENAILRVKAWCNAAPQFDRKRHHLKYIPPQDGFREEDLEHARIDQAPNFDDVLPDSVLDELHSHRASGSERPVQGRGERRARRRNPAPAAKRPARKTTAKRGLDQSSSSSSGSDQPSSSSSGSGQSSSSSSSS